MEHTACIFHTASHAADHPRCHQKLHTHAGTGLGNIQPHGRQVAVKLLRRLQKCQRTEQPEKNTALTCGERTAISDILSHGAVKAPEEPYIHHQQQKL